MSAFVVSREHIAALVEVALRGPSDADRGSEWNWGGWALSWRIPEAPAAEWTGDMDAYATAVREAKRELVGHRSLSGRSGMPMDPDALGDMLVRENVRSVMHRYPDTLDGGGIPGPTDEFYAAPYVHRGGRRLTCVETLKAASCLEYQSCEHAEWQASEACAFLESLRDSIMGSLPGYDAAPWSL